MSLADLMRKGALRAFATATLATGATHETASAGGFATATPATFATHDPESGRTVATVARVAVATAPDSKAANDPVPDPDRWCWPHSDAMNGAEIDRMVSRVELFIERGLNLIDATAIADKLVIRDRDGDDRRLCLECANLSGGAGGRRCSAWRRAGIGGQSVAGDVATVQQRCDGYARLHNEVPNG